MLTFTKKIHNIFLFQDARQVITKCQSAMDNVSRVLLTVCLVTLTIPAPAKTDFTGRPKMQSAIAVQVKYNLFVIVGVKFASLRETNCFHLYEDESFH